MSQAREINLIPYDVIMREKTEGRIWMWAVVVLLVTIVLLGVYALEKRKIGAVEGVISDLRLKKQEMEKKISQLNILRDKRDELARKERVINTLLHKRSLSFLFSELEKVINDNVWLISFNFEDGFSLIKSGFRGEDSDEWVETGHFIVKKNRSGTQKDSQNKTPGVLTSLQGIAKSNKDLAGFLRLLSQSDYFSEVNLKYSREGIYREIAVVEFKIETYLKKI